jgi:hypothetical protein
MARSGTLQRYCGSLLFLALILSPGMVQSAEDQLVNGTGKAAANSSDSDPAPFSIFTIGALVKLQAKERATKADIEKLIREVDKCDAGIARAKEIVSKATQACPTAAGQRGSDPDDFQGGGAGFCRYR